MDVVRVQVLSNSEESEKREGLVERLSSVGYLHVEDELVGEDSFDFNIIKALESDLSDVILMFEHYQGSGYLSSQRVTEHYPDKSVILVKTDDSKANVREIIRSGASDMVSYEEDIQSLTDMIYSIHQAHLKKQEAIKTKEERMIAQEGRVYPVLSTKGGTGSTFFASNFATMLARDKDSRVVIVDLDLDYGGVATAFNLQPDASVRDAIQDSLHLDSDLMESYLEEHKSGVFVLSGGSGPDIGSSLTSEDVDVVITLLKQSFDHIILDLPSQFIEAVNPAFSYAHTVFIVATPEILALKNTRSALNVFDSQPEYPMDRVKVILNKVAFGGIGRRDAEKTLEHDVFAEIPEDVRRVRKSQNEGYPYVNSHKNTDITKAFRKLMNDQRFETMKG